MEGDVTKVITALFLLAVFIGVMTQVLSNPQKSTTVLGATTDAITGVTSSLAGHGVNNATA